MNQDILNTFLNSTYSLGQAKRRLIVLKNYLLSKFFNMQSISSSKSPDSSLGSDDQAWLNSLGDDFLNKFSRENVYQLLENLEEQIVKMQTLTIFISFDIPEQEISKLGVWLRENISPQIMLETKIDPDLIAGAAFSWKGIYRDYSVRNTINQNKNRVLTSFKSFLK